jgi:hypothetical protein
MNQNGDAKIRPKKNPAREKSGQQKSGLLKIRPQNSGRKIKIRPE